MSTQLRSHQEGGHREHAALAKERLRCLDAGVLAQSGVQVGAEQKRQDRQGQQVLDAVLDEEDGEEEDRQQGVDERIQPDFLALAFVVAAFACLMLLVDRRTVPRWLGLIVSVFVSYQLRPSGFFIVVLLPVLGTIWLLVRNRERASWALGLGFLMALATLGPYVAFAGFRLARVGHFGLVSFGGCNAAGVAVTFLDESLVEELPDGVDRLGRKLLAARERKGLRPMTLDDDPAEFYGEYSTNVFRVSMAVARSQRTRRIKRLALKGETDPLQPESWLIEVNRRLGDFASEVFS